VDFDLQLSMDVLARTPATLQALLGGLAEPWARGDEGPETWSPFDVVGHLIDGEETDWTRITACSFSALMRLKRRSPSSRIVSGLSKGRRSYMRPPAKWQGWQRDSRMGRTSFVKSADRTTGRDSDPENAGARAARTAAGAAGTAAGEAGA